MMHKYRLLLLILLVAYSLQQVAVSITGDIEKHMKEMHEQHLYPHTQVLRAFIEEFNTFKDMENVVDKYFDPTAKVYFPLMSAEDNASVKKSHERMVGRFKTVAEFKTALNFMSRIAGSFQAIIPKSEFYESQNSPFVAVSVTVITKISLRAKVDGYLLVQFDKDKRIKAFTLYHSYQYFRLQYAHDALPGSRTPETLDPVLHERHYNALEQFLSKHDVDRYNLYTEEERTSLNMLPFEKIEELMKPNHILARLFPQTDKQKKMMHIFTPFSEEVVLGIPINEPENLAKGYAQASKYYNTIVKWADKVSVFIDDEVIILDDAEQSAAAGLIYNFHLKGHKKKLMTFKAIAFFTLDHADRIKRFELAFDQTKFLNEVVGISDKPRIVSSSST